MSNNCNAMITRGSWCYYCMLPFGHSLQHEHKELKWADSDKGAEPASLAGMPESFRREYEINSLRAEVAELRAQNEAMHDDLHEHDEKRHWAEVKVAELRETIQSVLDSANGQTPQWVYIGKDYTIADMHAALGNALKSSPAQGGSEP